MFDEKDIKVLKCHIIFNLNIEKKDVDVYDLEKLISYKEQEEDFKGICCDMDKIKVLDKEEKDHKEQIIEENKFIFEIDLSDINYNKDLINKTAQELVALMENVHKVKIQESVAVKLFVLQEKKYEIIA